MRRVAETKKTKTHRFTMIYSTNLNFGIYIKYIISCDNIDGSNDDVAVIQVCCFCCFCYCAAADDDAIQIILSTAPIN